MPTLQQYQDYPAHELLLHQTESMTKRQGFSSDCNVESRFWWEPFFTAFEEKLPAALRHTYHYFDVAMPRNLSECADMTEYSQDDMTNPTIDSPR